MSMIRNASDFSFTSLRLGKPPSPSTSRFLRLKQRWHVTGDGRRKRALQLYEHGHPCPYIIVFGNRSAHDIAMADAESRTGAAYWIKYYDDLYPDL